jgi:hypothetical protein
LGLSPGYTGGDVQLFGEDYKRIRDDLFSEGILQYMTCPRGNDLYGYRYDDYPASEVSIRGISKIKFQVLSSGQTSLVEFLQGNELTSDFKHLLYFYVHTWNWSSMHEQLLTGNNVVVEEVDEKMALRMLYEGAIYRRARDTYRVSCSFLIVTFLLKH